MTAAFHRWPRSGSAFRWLTTLLALLFLTASCASAADEEPTAALNAGRASADTSSGEDGGADGSTDSTTPVISVPAETTDQVEPEVDATSPEPAPPDTARPGTALPDTAAAMVDALNAAEQAVRDVSLSPEQRSEWGRRQQSLYRRLANNQDWATTVLAETDESIRAAVELNWTARENLRALLNTEELHDELPAWQVNPPAPADELLGYYKAAEEEWGIEWEFLAGINLIETRMGRIQGVSTAGALGPMQFLPTTWAECCTGDPTDPADAIPGAAKYLTIRGGPENMDRAIWGYNNSDYYVNAVTAYANVLMADEQAYYGYHAWEIYFLSTAGLVRIPVGYEQLEPIAVEEWLAANPDALFSE